MSQIRNKNHLSGKICDYDHVQALWFPVLRGKRLGDVGYKTYEACEKAAVKLIQNNQQ